MLLVVGARISDERLAALIGMLRPTTSHHDHCHPNSGTSKPRPPTGHVV